MKKIETSFSDRPLIVKLYLQFYVVRIKYKITFDKSINLILIRDN